MPTDYVLERGFGSSIDPAPCYYVIYNGVSARFVLHCELCGLDELRPDENGKAKVSHNTCEPGWNATVQLEGWPINYGFKAKK